jgi:CheY-like chemotaxis protein
LKALWAIVKRYARAAGLPWLQPRALRSGYILQQLATGASLSEVQSKIGHRQIATTRRYIELARSSPRGTAAQRRSCGVLIVHDDQPARAYLRSLLEDAGHQVFEAPDAISARDMLRLSRLSLVVLLYLADAEWNRAELLSELSRRGNLLGDYRVIAVFAGNAPLPKQLIDMLVACNIPILTSPVDPNALFIHVVRAYGELGGWDVVSTG